MLKNILLVLLLVQSHEHYSWLSASLGIRPPINFDELPYFEIEAQAAIFNNILLIILAVLVVIFIAYYAFSQYWEKKHM